MIGFCVYINMDNMALYFASLLSASTQFIKKMEDHNHEANVTLTVKPLNLDGGQCTWCGKYGHSPKQCAFLK
ncbi:hypothetical protein BD408DRAFT_448020 [Parasitella parasitica]|nr:hypothetical protein BD408DRAFT_448020 [Parasitella parasitica]